MKYFKVTVELGHVGSGRSVVATRHIRAADAADAFNVASRIPRVKRVLCIERVYSIRDFILGLLRDINATWFLPRCASDTVFNLLTCALKLGGVLRGSRRPRFQTIPKHKARRKVQVS